MTQAKSGEPTVWILDDDEPLRTSIVWLLQAVGYRVLAFASPGEFLRSFSADQPGCLVLDLRLPEMTGLEMWRTLRERGCRNPVIVISGHADTSIAMEAKYLGAMDFLQKPFDPPVFLERIAAALRSDAEARQREADHAQFDR